MSVAAQAVAPQADLIASCRAALGAVEDVLSRAQASLSRRLSRDGKLDSAALDREQHAAHGFAWLA